MPDEDLANKLKAALQEKMLELAHTELITVLEGQIQIILAEAKGDSWLQRNWRPLLMMISIIIIANNYILHPYLSLLATAFVKDATFQQSLLNTKLELPGGLWALLNLGVGGYIGARTVEKIKGVTNSVLPFTYK